MCYIISQCRPNINLIRNGDRMSCINRHMISSFTPLFSTYVCFCVHLKHHWSSKSRAWYWSSKSRAWFPNVMNYVFLSTCCLRSVHKRYCGAGGQEICTSKGGVKKFRILKSGCQKVQNLKKGGDKMTTKISKKNQIHYHIWAVKTNYKLSFHLYNRALWGDITQSPWYVKLFQNKFHDSKKVLKLRKANVDGSWKTPSCCNTRQIFCLLVLIVSRVD